MTQDGSTGGRRRRHDATRTGAQSVLTSKGVLASKDVLASKGVLASRSILLRRVRPRDTAALSNGEDWS